MVIGLCVWGHEGGATGERAWGCDESTRVGPGVGLTQDKAAVTGGL